MELDGKKSSVSEIFPNSTSRLTDKVKYFIPIYQRNYSWSADNVDELLTDIMNEDEGYYIGNLLLTSHSKNSENEFDVEDGQQRLITVSLILLAIYAAQKIG